MQVGYTYLVSSNISLFVENSGKKKKKTILKVPYDM